MLSPKQIPHYWRLWSQVLKATGWQTLSANEKNLRRYEFHKQHKLPESMTAFNPRSDFDTFKAACLRVIKGSGPASDTAPEDGERKRLVWRITEDARIAGLDKDYLKKLSTDLYGLGCWELLAIEDLTNLRDLIHNRASAHLGHDTRSLSDTEIVNGDSTVQKPAGELTPAGHHSSEDPF